MLSFVQWDLLTIFPFGIVAVCAFSHSPALCHVRFHYAVTHWSQGQATERHLSLLLFSAGWRLPKMPQCKCPVSVGKGQMHSTCQPSTDEPWGSLNENDPYRRKCVNSQPPDGGTVWERLWGMALLVDGVLGFLSPHQALLTLCLMFVDEIGALSDCSSAMPAYLSAAVLPHMLGNDSNPLQL